MWGALSLAAGRGPPATSLCCLRVPGLGERLRSAVLKPVGSGCTSSPSQSPAEAK